MMFGNEEFKGFPNPSIIVISRSLAFADLRATLLAVNSCHGFMGINASSHSHPVLTG